jgi:hypothetical protein
LSINHFDIVIGEQKMRAKFKCNSVTTYESGSITAVLYPVIEGSEENKIFWKYTPNGSVELQINNPNAVGFFQPNKEYYLDFTVAELDEQINDNPAPIEPTPLVMIIPDEKVLE